MERHGITIDREAIAEFYRRNRIRRLALFGSFLGDDFGPDGDIDVLVDFEPDARIGLIRMARMKIDLSDMIGRKVDLRSPGDLSRYFRDQAAASAEVLYAE
jgi:predicted nucleotidyltransferase